MANDSSDPRLQGFYRFLSSPANDVLGPAPMMPSSRTVSQEMTLPLAHYYCDSSHNSYLTGKQVWAVLFCAMLCAF